MYKNITDISNILVIGSGGAGLRSAIEAKLNGLNVKVIGKRNKEDAHTVLAAGGINAALGNLDKDDCWEQHFADTYLEGYGIGDPNLIENMVRESPKLIKEIDKWGANLQRLGDGKLDQRFFGAHTYRRTCYKGDYTGLSILKTLLSKAKSLGIEISDNLYVSDLLINKNKCFGAFSFDISTGERNVHIADAVILCTGGNTRLWSKSSSRYQENTGDGLHLALKAGCKLMDMEMVQFHPTGILFPEDISGTLVTEAVRGEGGKLINGLGERFMKKYDLDRMELSSRDKVAIANYTEMKEGRASPNGGVYLDISHKDKNFIIEKLPKIYRLFLEKQMLDISEEPMEVAPTAHYSMGGIIVNSIDHSTNIEGLYAAGEVAGGLHGANRLGGNSLAEILVFGKAAGKAASIYSKSLSVIERCKKSIKNAHENLDKKIKKGDEISLKIQNDLGKVLWDYCGVIKDQENLKLGLQKIEEIKKRALEADVRVSNNNNQDLINKLNLDASIISAECTIKSALIRKESRGAHQRSDFPNLDPNEKVNYSISLKDNNLNISRKEVKPIKDELKEFIQNTSIISDFKSRLLE